MSSEAEGDCPTETTRSQGAAAARSLAAGRGERRGRAGLRRGRPGSAAVRPSLRRQHQRCDVRHHRVRADAAGRRAAGRIVGAAAGGAAGLHQRSADRGAVHRGVCVRADVLAAAAVPVARRPRLGDVHGVVAGSDDPDLTAGRARPRRGPVLVGVPRRVGRRTGARQPDRGSGSGGALRHLRSGAAGRRGSGFRQPAAFSGGGAGGEYRARRLGAHGACVTGRTAPRCSPTSRRAGRRSGCGSRWCRCSSSRYWVAARASRAWRWRRSRSATSRPSSPAVISPTGSGGASCSSSG